MIRPYKPVFLYPRLMSGSLLWEGNSPLLVLMLKSFFLVVKTVQRLKRLFKD